MSEPPSFEIDTESELKVFGSEPTSIHARQLGEKPEGILCEIGGFDRCKLPFANVQGLGNHKRQIHQPKIKEVYQNDVIRVAFKATQTPVWDPKTNLYAFPDEITIPDKYLIKEVDHTASYINTPSEASPKRLVARMLLVKRDKVVSK